jgi:hypothetical protein|nr:MAG TPA: hypothetical protein [Caudoviricetes sp.]
MRTRDRSYDYYGISPEDVKKLRNYCRNMGQEDRLRLFQCAISKAPGLELLIYESITEGIGYISLRRRRGGIPAKADDFYAYQRRTLADFYDWLRMTGRWK